MKKIIRPLQQIVDSYLSSDPCMHGLYVSWSTPVAEYELQSSHPSGASLHPFHKSHYVCLEPSLLGPIQSGAYTATSPLGINNLTYCDHLTVPDVAALLTDYEFNIVFITDHASLLDNVWLTRLLADDVIDIEVLSPKLSKLLLHAPLTEFISYYKILCQVPQISSSRARSHKTAFFVAASSEKVTFQVSSALFSLFPSSIVFGLPLPHETNASLPLSSLSLFLPDTAISSPRSLEKSNSLHYNHRVTALINLYKRLDSCVEIYKSLQSQSCPPQYIYIWVNGSISAVDLCSLRHQMPSARFILSDENIGVWARFSFALNFNSEYTVIFDDDTVPGPRWLENCLVSMSQRAALYGTVGLIYHMPPSYMNHKRVGWCQPNSIPEEVDIIGHSWFFRTEWLKQYWFTTDSLDLIPFCGEDMHFSYALQLCGIPSFVPPHPTSNRDLWGSIKGFEAGTGQEAISISGKGSQMDVPFQRLLARGFKLLAEGKPHGA
jgi:hypothetical protein